jgi:hypothetical protein
LADNPDGVVARFVDFVLFAGAPRFEGMAMLEMIRLGATSTTSAQRRHCSPPRAAPPRPRDGASGLPLLYPPQQEEEGSASRSATLAAETTDVLAR